MPTHFSASDSMDPSETAGGLTPRPRYDRDDSSRMAAATTRVVLTTIGPMMLGRMWRNMIRALVAPEARAASTNSFSLMDRNRPRTTRAIDCQNSTDRVKMISVVELTWPTIGSSLP